jgi:hypothetical protein
MPKGIILKGIIIIVIIIIIIIDTIQNITKVRGGPLHTLYYVRFYNVFIKYLQSHKVLSN